MNDKHLEKYVERFPAARVAVIGDLMLDRYIWGSATRISQEAPVPVVKVERETQAPGGAANVVANLLELGGQAGAYGFAGHDMHGECLRRILAAKGAAHGGIIAHPDRDTTVKTRVICNHQQVVRIDHEKRDALADGDQWFKKLKTTLCHALESGLNDAVIIEDYAKGVLSAAVVRDVRDTAHEQGVITALDPHPSHNFNVQRLSLITPNRSEAFALAGVYESPPVMPLAEDKPLLKVGKRLQKLWDPEHLLITLGGQGMALFSRAEAEPLHIPTRAQSVYDVSGAGDTVTASFVLTLLAGASPQEAAQVANHAAGIVVGKVGTLPVSATELLDNLKET